MIVLCAGKRALLRLNGVDKKTVMADKSSKQPLNAPGAWYVDTSCSLCRTCLEEAPSLLKVNPDDTAAYFARQPQNGAEMQSAQRAMEVCPTLAIGNDG